QEGLTDIEQCRTEVSPVIFKVTMLGSPFTSPPRIDVQRDIAMSNQIVAHGPIHFIEFSIAGMTHHRNHSGERPITIGYIQICCGINSGLRLEVNILDHTS